MDLVLGISIFVWNRGRVDSAKSLKTMSESACRTYMIFRQARVWVILHTLILRKTTHTFFHNHSRNDDDATTVTATATATASATTAVSES